jgi:hypothetical protein
MFVYAAGRWTARIATGHSYATGTPTGLQYPLTQFEDFQSKSAIPMAVSKSRAMGSMSIEPA